MSSQILTVSSLKREKVTCLIPCVKYLCQNKWHVIIRWFVLIHLIIM